MIYKIWLPNALVLGVDYNLFWSLNPKKLESFLNAYNLKEKKKIDYINLEAWLNGVYTNYALACAFGENKDYPELPIDLYSAEEDIQQKNEESDIFDAYATVFNQQFK